MKKLLVFMLILCMAYMASAAPIDISVNGDKYPVDSEISLSPSDYLTLDIWNSVILTTTNTPITFALICQSACASISGGVPNEALTQAVIMVFDNSVIPQPIGEGMGGIWGGVTVFESTIAAGTTLVDGIIFHCESANGPTLVSLIQLDDGTGVPTGVVYDTVTIHQIPEPATIVLLCLGGLLLRKK